MAGDGAPDFHSHVAFIHVAFTRGPPRLLYSPPMGFYAKYLFPHLMDWTMGARKFQEQRGEALKPLHGEVLEIGFGTGLNLAHYPPTVAKMVALEPACLLPRVVVKRIAAVTIPAALGMASAERLPFDHHAFDRVLSAWTLCRTA